MPSCMFIGEHTSSQETYHALIAVTEELIVSENVSTFYVGNQGSFDHYAQMALCTLKKIYPDINAFVVLAYIPGKQSPYEEPPLLETIYPEGLEKVPPRYAINHRNLWMLKNSSFVISCPSAFGNSAKLVAKSAAFGKNRYQYFQRNRQYFPFTIKMFTIYLFNSIKNTL